MCGDTSSPPGGHFLLPPGVSFRCCLRFNGQTGSSGCWVRSLGAGRQCPSQFGGTQSGKVPTLRSPRSSRVPAPLSRSLCSARGCWLGEGMNPQGAPGAGGDLGVFLAAAATCSCHRDSTARVPPLPWPRRSRDPRPALGGGQPPHQRPHRARGPLQHLMVLQLIKRRCRCPRYLHPPGGLLMSGC